MKCHIEKRTVRRVANSTNYYFSIYLLGWETLVSNFKRFFLPTSVIQNLSFYGTEEFVKE